MKKDKKIPEPCKPNPGKGCDAVYGMGLLGSLVYFIQNAEGFGGFLFGIVKAVFWPGFVVYELLKFLKI